MSITYKTYSLSLKNYSYIPANRKERSRYYKIKYAYIHKVVKKLNKSYIVINLRPCKL